MFKKRGRNDEDYPAVDNNEIKSEGIMNNDGEKSAPSVQSNEANTILKGSKLIGDINVTCDLELSGEIEGNIKSEKNSNIVITGSCKGNIETREGNVDIRGELQGGNIIAGNEVRISGKFQGGDIKAKGKIYINGEFDGKLEGQEVEIGPESQGKGQIEYKEFISIAKGAKIEAQVSQAQKELKLVKSTEEEKTQKTEDRTKGVSSN